jgi:hypothetical protein
MRKELCLCLLLALFPVSGSTAESIDLSGIWRGIWNSLRSSGYYGNMTLMLRQRGDQVFGTARVTNTICSPVRTVRGTVDGPMVHLQMFDVATQGQQLNISWSIVGEQGTAMSAVYYFDVPADDPCYGDGGTWLLTRKAD